MKTTYSKKNPLLPILMTLASLGFSAPVWAEHSCGCDSKCSANCADGKTEECTCKTCDCAKGKECSHGKCQHHPKKVEPKK